MNCPNCGKEMEKGYIPVAPVEDMFWIPENVKRPIILDNDKLQRLNGVALSVPRLRRKDAKLDAYLCRRCKQCLFSYDENASLFV